MSVCSFWSFSSGDGSEEIQKKQTFKTFIHSTIHSVTDEQNGVKMCCSYLFSSLLSSQADAQVVVLASTLSGRAIRKNPISQSNSAQYVNETKMADIHHSHPWSGVKRGKLGMHCGDNGRKSQNRQI